MHWFTLEFFYLLVFDAGLKLILDILSCSYLHHVFIIIIIVVVVVVVVVTM